MKFIYFDTSVIRSLSDQPEMWDRLHHQFIKTFGRNYRTIESYYLFFEYIGFTKTKYLTIPAKFKEPNLADLVDNDKLIKIKPKDYVNTLDKSLRKFLYKMLQYTGEKLGSLQKEFKELIEERKKRISTYPVAQMFVNMLFDNIFLLMQENFEQFVKVAARYLTWDMFCSIQPRGLSLEILKSVKKKQLDFWLQYWEKGILLPFGKIIDDLSKDYEMDFSSNFKNFEDMVDSELHTYLALGYKSVLGYEDDGKACPVHGVVHLPGHAHALPERHELALKVINNIQETLGKELDKRSGSLYLLDEKTYSFKAVDEPIFKTTPTELEIPRAFKTTFAR